MSGQAIKDLAIIKSTLGITQISFPIISKFFIGISIINILKILIYNIGMIFLNESIMFSSIIQLLYLFSLVIYYIYIKNRLKVLENINNNFLINMWSIMIIICAFLSWVIPNTMFTNILISNVKIDMEIYVVLSQIFQLTLTLIPIIIGIVVMGLFLKNSFLYFIGCFLTAIYLLSFYLYYRLNINFNIFLLYNVIYSSIFLIIGIVLKLNKHKLFGDLHESE